MSVPLLAIVAAAVGCVLLAPFARPTTWFSLALAGSLLSGHADQVGLPLSPDRVLMSAAFVSLLFALTEHRGDEVRRIRPVEILLVIVAAYGVCSAIGAGTFTDSTAFFGLLDRLGVMPFIGFALAHRLYGTERDRKVLLAVMVGVGAYLSLTAFFEIVGANGLVFPRYILDESIGSHFGRARGPFVEAAANGLALFECGVACVLGADIFLRRRWRLVAGIVSLMCAVGILLTLTRAAWIGAIAGILVGSLFHPKLRRRLVHVSVGGAVLVIATLTLVPGLADRATTRADSQLPVWDRLNSNTTGLAVLEAHPLFGVGWNRFPDVNASYARQADGYPLTGTWVSVHNVPLSHLAELGYLGGGLWILAVVMAAWAAFKGSRYLPRHWRPAIAAVFVNWAVVGLLGPVGYAFPNLCVWLWLGIGAAPLATVKRPSAHPPEAALANLAADVLA